MEFLKDNNLIIKIFLLSLTIGLIYVFITLSRPLTFDDTLSWDTVAWNFLSGRGFLESDNNPTCWKKQWKKGAGLAI